MLDQIMSYLVPNKIFLTNGFDRGNWTNENE